MPHFTLIPAYVFARWIGSTLYFMKPSTDDLFKPGKPFHKMHKHVVYRSRAMRYKRGRVVTIQGYEYKVIWINHRGHVDQQETDYLQRLRNGRAP